MGRTRKKIVKIPEHCATIGEYEKSAWWKAKSTALLEDKGCRCAICGRMRWKWLTRAKRWKRMLRFSTHHISYARAGNELPEDLVTLCSLCHTTSHELLRYRNISPMYEELAGIVDKYFRYDGADTFVPW